MLLFPLAKKLSSKELVFVIFIFILMISYTYEAKFCCTTPAYLIGIR